MTRDSEQPTFWETQAEFVRTRGVATNRKKWTRVDELAWGRFYQAREVYWSKHRQWIDSLRNFEQRKDELYLQLLDAVGFVQSPAWINRCMRIYVQKQTEMKPFVDQPVFADTVADFCAQWDAQDSAADTRTTFDSLVAGFAGTAESER